MLKSRSLVMFLNSYSSAHHHVCLFLFVLLLIFYKKFFYQFFYYLSYDQNVMTTAISLQSAFNTQQAVYGRPMK